jgi:hypothetical protein
MRSKMHLNILRESLEIKQSNFVGKSLENPENIPFKYGKCPFWNFP